MACKYWILPLFISLCFSACYSFKGISIAPTISTFYVDQFQNGAGNAPPDIGQRFSEELKDIILRSSRLNYDESAPDIEFSGTITSFNVQSVAPERRDDSSGATDFGSSLNRLNISISVEYVNNQDAEDIWTQSFSFFQDFDNTQNLTDVQDDLIEEIFDQLTNDIFTRAFTNW